ncbi:hypothetical protein FJY94_04520 [Candidatus Kaiserbacteria bacterium]|nr:hypothetical protein [Candidatus Kaiserbacteria bacterium]
MSNPDTQAYRNKAQTLQKAFFSAPNRCDPMALSSDPEDGRALKATLRRHASGATDRGVLLPFRAIDTGPTAWFVCAASAQMQRALLDEIRAFLGPSYVEERPQDRIQDAADLHAQPLIEAAGWFDIRFDTPGGNSDTMVLRQWRIYDDLVNRRPRAASYVPNSFHQLRALFDRNLLARNEAGALAAMAILRERFGVSAENRQFLEIRLNAAFERWDDIAEHPLLTQLIHLQLPPETYGDVMEALYRSQVQAYESANTLEPLLLQFSQAVAGPAQSLFSTRRTSRRPAVLKAFVLYELIQPEPQLAICARLLKEIPIGAFGAVDRILRERCAQHPAEADIGLAQKALANEQFDRAWELFWPLTDAVDVLRGLIACARESDEPAKVAAVLARLDATEASIRNVVESASATRLARLRTSYQAPSLPDSLSAQFARWPNESENQYVERWTEFARSVDPKELLAESGVVVAAIDTLFQLTVEEPALIERLYPLWHELFIERTDPDPRLIPLYLEMLEVLRARDVFQRTDQELLHQILVAIVDSGDDSAYRHAVDTITKVFQDIRSPLSLGWALDVCDSLSQRRVRDANARLRLLIHVVQACQEFGSRLDPLQIHQLHMLVQEANIDPPKLPAPPSPESVETLPVDETPYRVAIYSLDEAATKRAIEILKSLHPHWIIETNSDHICSDRLKAMARNAHVFVFAWRCSKHAAYYCVKANSQKENLVMARGVGTTSLVVAVVQFLTETVGGVSGRH